MDNQTFQLPDAPEPAQPTNEAAANLIRGKIENLYSKEPDATEEVKYASHSEPHARRSKHQQFMHELVESGKSSSQIQSEWHEYYAGLSDEEKHEVWREFYGAHATNAKALQTPSIVAPDNIHQPEYVVGSSLTKRGRRPAARSAATTDPKPTSITAHTLHKHPHLKSLAFGLACGALVIFIFMFSLFNERIIAPFISPSKAVSSTPIINDSTVASSKDPLIIIPKINVEIPVIYDEPSVEEKAVQTALERGVVHYADTALPGEDGNAVIVGHSSNNIFNKGKYKFAFVLLSRLEKNDTFSLQKDGKRYTYRVVDKEIVKPTDVGVLAAKSKVATATLITCDPPGTSINRLVVIGEQISPDPATNIAARSSNSVATTKTTIIPSNSPSLWSRFAGIFSN